MAQIISPDEIDFGLYLEETELQQKVRPASAFIDDMLTRMFTPNMETEYYLPWAKTHELFQFRGGEVTLWAGINGHGKSLMTGQAALSLMAQGARCCMASFEMKPRKSIQRMIPQWVGFPAPSIKGAPGDIAEFKGVAQQFGKWSDSRMWLYDQQGTVKTETVVAVVRYCAKELGIQHMFVDSLMKCVRGEDDYNGQKYLVDEFCAIAKDHDMHIHLVHHIKKLKDEDEIPGKFDAKGSGAITDQVDNLLIHWRNKRKETDIQVGKLVSEDEPDAMLICNKQRNGSGWEGRMHLWCDQGTKQFRANAHGPVVAMDVWPHVPAVSARAPARFGGAA